MDFVTFRGNFNWKLIDNAVLCRCLTFARRRKATEPSSMPSWEIECKFQILRILLDLQIWVHAEKNTQWNITPQKIILSPIQKSRELTRISGYSFSILISLLRQIFCEVVVYLPRLSRIQLTFQKNVPRILKSPICDMKLLQS